MKFAHRLIPFSIILVLSLSSTSCAIVSLKNWFQQSGQVVYEGNKKPVPNAFVAAVWRGKNKNSQDNDSLCYHVETAKTNNSGEFTIPGWKEYFEFGHVKDKAISVIIYKPGFWSETLQNAPTKSQNTYKLEAISSKNRQISTKNRLKYLQKLVGLTSCHVKGKENRVALKDLYGQILSEAEDVAESPVDKKIVKSLRQWTTFVATK